MNKLELSRCEKLLEDGIRHIMSSKEYFTEAYEAERSGDTIKQIQCELQGQNSLGYAEGINQCLATLKFHHQNMTVLTDLLK